jgi:hypothetical protein
MDRLKAPQVFTGREPANTSNCGGMATALLRKTVPPSRSGRSIIEPPPIAARWTWHPRAANQLSRFLGRGQGTQTDSVVLDDGEVPGPVVAAG